MPNQGKLYLIPTPLGDDAVHTLPAYVIQTLHRLDYFIVERAKTARRFIKSTEPERPINVLTVFELNKYDPADGIARFLEPAAQGHDIGVLSEAGCPGVADPGALVVQEAHRRGIEVVPMVGPSSLLLGLMASGMNGQSFTFHGYLPHKPNELSSKLKQLELLSQRHQQTQLFIETPYRNNNLLEMMIKTLSPNTQFAVAVDISLPTETIISLPIHQWKKQKLPDFHKRPAIFLLYAGK